MGKKLTIRAHAFTLVELLVSLLIIAILSVLLISVVGRAREKAQQTSCMGQLRQLFTGLAAYSQDHYGFLPRGASADNDDSGFDEWKGAWLKPTSNIGSGVPAYLGGEEAFNRLLICPANKDSKPPVTPYLLPGYPYVCNYEVMTQNGLSKKPANLRSIDKSKVVLLLDSAVGNQWGMGFTATAGWTRIAERHGNFLNALWADGRISSMRKEEITVQDMIPVVR